jgi:hypothetical protein
MLEYPGYFVVAWLLPVTLQVVVPLMMLVGWSAYGVSKVITQKSSSKEKGKSLQERRRHSRLSVEKLGEMVVRQGDVVLGKVRDFSAAGIGIDAIAPAKFAKVEKVSLSCNERESVFSLELQPRWRKNRKSGVIFGAAIANHPVGWDDFVKSKGEFV